MRRLALAAIAVALSISGALPTDVAAQSRPTSFWLYKNMSCVGGQSSDRAQVRVIWKRADGRIKLRDTYTAGRDGGWWEACAASPDARLQTGDLVSATVDGLAHRLTIPRLRLWANADTETIGGRAPARALIALAWDGGGGEMAVRVRRDGRWRYSDPSLEFGSGFHAYARWRSAGGDTVTFENVAP